MTDGSSIVVAEDATGRPETNTASCHGSDRRVPKLLMDYEEARWSMGVSERTLRNMVSDGRLAVVRFGGRTLFYVEDLRTLIEAHRTINDESTPSRGPKSVQSRQ